MATSASPAARAEWPSLNTKHTTRNTLTKRTGRSAGAVKPGASWATGAAVVGCRVLLKIDGCNAANPAAANQGEQKGPRFNCRYRKARRSCPGFKANSRCLSPMPVSVEPGWGGRLSGSFRGRLVAKEWSWRRSKYCLFIQYLLARPRLSSPSELQPKITRAGRPARPTPRPRC